MKVEESNSKKIIVITPKLDLSKLKIGGDKNNGGQGTNDHRGETIQIGPVPEMKVEEFDTVHLEPIDVDDIIKH